MTDYDPAMLNAIVTCWPQTIQLYCFFHLQQLCSKRFNQNARYNEMLMFLRDCHYSVSQEDYDQIWNQYMDENNHNGHALEAFCDWMYDKDEIDGMTRWQIYHTEQGL